MIGIVAALLGACGGAEIEEPQLPLGHDVPPQAPPAPTDTDSSATSEVPTTFVPGQLPAAYAPLAAPLRIASAPLPGAESQHLLLVGRVGSSPVYLEMPLGRDVAMRAISLEGAQQIVVDPDADPKTGSGPYKISIPRKRDHAFIIAVRRSLTSTQAAHQFEPAARDLLEAHARDKHSKGKPHTTDAPVTSAKGPPAGVTISSKQATYLALREQDMTACFERGGASGEAHLGARNLCVTSIDFFQCSDTTDARIARAMLTVQPLTPKQMEQRINGAVPAFAAHRLSFHDYATIATNYQRQCADFVTGRSKTPATRFAYDVVAGTAFATIRDCTEIVRRFRSGTVADHPDAALLRRIKAAFTSNVEDPSGAAACALAKVATGGGGGQGVGTLLSHDRKTFAEALFVAVTDPESGGQTQVLSIDTSVAAEGGDTAGLLVAANSNLNGVCIRRADKMDLVAMRAAINDKVLNAEIACEAIGILIGAGGFFAFDSAAEAAAGDFAQDLATDSVVHDLADPVAWDDFVGRYTPTQRDKILAAVWNLRAQQYKDGLMWWTKGAKLLGRTMKKQDISTCDNMMEMWKQSLPVCP